MAGKMGNEFPKMGNPLPIGAAKSGALSYEAAIAAAMRRELGGSHKAIKTLMKRSGASARTAKNWLSGASGPSGPHLIELMRSSDEIFATVLRMCGRGEVSPSDAAAKAGDLLRRAIQLIESQC